jgi:type IV pilus assembly protein PilB
MEVRDQDVNSVPPKEDPVSRIGDAMVKEGLITEEQLARALRVQGHLETPRQLGEILTEMGYVTRHAVSDIIRKYGKTMRLGEMLLEQGLVSTEDLNQCLVIHKEQNKPVGQVLVEQGAINERTLLRNLAHQAQVPYVEPSFAMVDSQLLKGVSPEYLERYHFVPFSRNEEGVVTVVVTDLRDEELKRIIAELYQGNCTLALGPNDAVSQVINDFSHYRADGTADVVEAAGEVESDEDSVVQLVNHIITQAIDEGASDIHIEPMADRIRLRYRIDGVLAYKTDLPLDLLQRMMSRLKILADCNITESRRHQGGRFNLIHKGGEFDLRLSLYVAVHGESAVIRVLNKTKGLVSLQELGMGSAMLERFREDVLDMPTGVVLITGPTGSGKTTTLYSSLDYNNDIDTKIITVEDPVEYLIDGLIQCSVHDKVGRTFDGTLREIVRQDPDIIVLGEIRDHITAQTAIQAALTGHKVYSTFHTEDTIGGLVRLMNMEIEAFLISSTVISVVAQRLLRRICDHCQQPYLPPPAEIRRLGLDANEIRDYEFKRGQGCKHCNFTGYSGRVAVYELLVLNDYVKEAILDKKPAHQIRQISMDTTGLVSMREDALSKVFNGVTSFEEVLKHTPRTFELRPISQIVALTQ